MSAEILDNLRIEVVMRVRSFDAEFYKSLQEGGSQVAREAGENVVKAEKGKVRLEDLFGE